MNRIECNDRLREPGKGGRNRAAARRRRRSSDGGRGRIGLAATPRSRRSRALRLLAIALAVVALAHGTPLDAADGPRTVTLVGDPWPPYFLGGLGEEASGGVAVELMHAIFERLEETELSIPMVPWNRALKEVERGTKDGIGILLKTPEREEYMDYTEAVFNSYNRVWYSVESFPEGFAWREYADLQPYAIGVVRGHSYGIEMDRLAADGTLSTIEVSSVGQLFAMLSKGRIDLAVADRLVGDSLVKTHNTPSERIRATETAAAGEVYYIAFSKRSEARHLIPEINRIVAELREEGVIERLVGDDALAPVGE